MESVRTNILTIPRAVVHHKLLSQILGNYLGTRVITSMSMPFSVNSTKTEFGVGASRHLMRQNADCRIHSSIPTTDQNPSNSSFSLLFSAHSSPIQKVGSNHPHNFTEAQTLIFLYQLTRKKSLNNLRYNAKALSFPSNTVSDNDAYLTLKRIINKKFIVSNPYSFL